MAEKSKNQTPKNMTSSRSRSPSSSSSSKSKSKGTTSSSLTPRSAGSSPSSATKRRVTPSLILPKTTTSEDLGVEDSHVFALIAGFVAIAPAIFVFLNVFPWFKDDHLRLGLTGMGIMTSVYYLIHRTLTSFNVTGEKRVLGTLMLFVTFTAATDTVISSSMIGLTHTGSFYIVMGEKYFGCAYGWFCLAWDGVFHLLIQSLIAYYILTKRQYKFTLLVWCGSVINSMFPLLLGAASGPYSKEIQLSTALNGPYVFVPVAVAMYAAFLSPRRDGPGTRVSSSSAPTDVLLTFYHLVLITAHVARAMYVMGSQTPTAMKFVTSVDPVLQLDRNHQLSSHAFLFVQVMQNFFWMVPFHCVSLYETAHRSWTNKRSPAFGRYGVEFSALVLGAYLQTEACWMGTTLFHWEAHTLKSREGMQPSVWFWYIHAVTLLGAAVQLVHFYMQDVQEAE